MLLLCRSFRTIAASSCCFCRTTSSLKQLSITSRSLHYFTRRLLRVKLHNNASSFVLGHLYVFKVYYSQMPRSPRGHYTRAPLSRDLISRQRNTTMYWTAFTIFMFGMSFAAVPLYRIFCQASAFGGTTRKAGHGSEIESLVPVKDRLVRISFTSTVDARLPWTFEPLQTEIWVNPGETALAFFQATNQSSVPIIGISTYNVNPFEAGAYFNKIQCFCFEEQMLSPGETVDMPVFFYLDPQFAEDPLLDVVTDVTLSYTFFESEGSVIPPHEFAPRPLSKDSLARSVELKPSPATTSTGQFSTSALTVNA